MPQRGLTQLDTCWCCLVPASSIRMGWYPFLGTWELLQYFPGSYFKCLLSISPTVYWEFWPQKSQMPSVDICRVWTGLSESHFQSWIIKTDTNQQAGYSDADKYCRNSRFNEHLMQLRSTQRAERKFSLCFPDDSCVLATQMSFALTSTLKKSKISMNSIQGVQLEVAALTYTTSYMWE